MDEQDLCLHNIAALGQLLRTRALSPVEATSAALARLRRLDGQLNSFITILEESALIQARRVEDELGRALIAGRLPLRKEHRVDNPPSANGISGIRHSSKQAFLA